jgi:hypothetical protein
MRLMILLAAEDMSDGKRLWRDSSYCVLTCSDIFLSMLIASLSPTVFDCSVMVLACSFVGEPGDGWLSRVGLEVCIY